MFSSSGIILYLIYTIIYLSSLLICIGECCFQFSTQIFLQQTYFHIKCKHSLYSSVVANVYSLRVDLFIHECHLLFGFQSGVVLG